jgi:putative endonuclease
MDTKKLGNFGEEITCRYLTKKRFKILERNFVKNWDSKKKGEIDIVAKKDNVIIFVEVKTITSAQSGGYLPEDKVDSQKKRKLIKLAESWLIKNKLPLDLKWQIDVVSVRVDLDLKKAKIRHLENAIS